jgi:hypothetical protein
MPRTGYRVRLEGGLKLDINQLARVGLISTGRSHGAGRYPMDAAGSSSKRLAGASHASCSYRLR